MTRSMECMTAAGSAGQPTCWTACIRAIDLLAIAELTSSYASTVCCLSALAEKREMDWKQMRPTSNLHRHQSQSTGDSEPYQARCIVAYAKVPHYHHQ
jgi:hypothetical protein